MRERFQRVREVFEAAIEQPPEGRAAFVREACGADAELREHVERLLRHSDSEAAVLDTRPLAGPMSAALRSALGEGGMPERIGEFKLLRRVGRGGMGEVYEAEQEHPRRRVAVKLLRSDLLTPEARRRFEFEAQVLGTLQHPGIGCIHAAGVIQLPGGDRPYFVMEFIRGRPLDEYARAAGLGVRERLELFARVAEAVDHAHRAGVVHRDLKPSNILVDEGGNPKIVDFGVARVLNPAGGESSRSMHTVAGELVGTVAYMSPEQVSGGGHEADARSDVYALGLVMFELLAERLPLDLRGRSLPEMARIIREDEPTGLGSVNTKFRGELDTIAAKALEKDPLRRYAGAGELAADVRRYLRDEPIVARPATTTYQLRKFARRHRELVGGVAAVFAVLIISLVTISRLAVRESRQRRVAEVRATEARWESYRNCIAAADRSLRLDDAARAIQLLESAPEGMRGWEWRYLRGLSDRSRLSITASASPVRGALLAGGAVWTAGDDGLVARWDPTDGRPLSWQSAHGGVGGASVLSVSPDGRTCISGSPGGEVAAWNASDGSLRWRFQGEGEIHHQLFFPDSARVAVPMRQRVAFVDTVTGIETGSMPLPVSGVERPAINAGGDLMVCLVGQVLACYSISDGREMWRRNGRACFDADGTRVWNFSGAARGVLVAEARTGRTIVELADTAGLARGATGRLLPTLIGSSTIALIDPVAGARDGRGAETIRLAGHAAGVCWVWLSSEENTVVSSGTDGVVKLWDAGTLADAFIVAPSNDAVLAGAVAPDGRHAATVGWGGVKMWDLASGAEVWTTFPVKRELHAAAFSPDGTRLAVAGYDQLVAVISTDDGRTLARSPAMGAPITRLAWTGDDVVVAATASGKWFEFGAGDGSPVHEGSVGESGVTALAVSTSGREMALGDARSIVWLGSRGALTPLEPGVLAGAGGITGLGFDPSGGMLAVGGDDGSVTVVSLAERRMRWSLKPLNVGAARELAFSPDGARLAVGFGGGLVHLIDAATGDVLLELHPAPPEVCALGFANDASSLIAVAKGSPGGITAFETKGRPERAEARAIQARAREVVDGLRNRLQFAEEIALAAGAAPGETAAVREAAAALAHARGDHPNYLNGDAWAVVRFPNRAAEEYALALAKAEHACRIRPEEHAFWNTLGVAQLRVGRLDDAIATLMRCIEMPRPDGTPPHPIDLLALAIARAKMGDFEPARSLLERTQASQASGQYAPDPEYDWFRSEVESLLKAPAGVP